MKKGEIFRSVSMSKKPSNYFDLSHDFKFSTVMGKLTPVLNRECIPGDVWKFNTSCLVRLAPMLAPVMHRAKVDIQFFFVPYRLLWDNWELFITGGDEPLPLPSQPSHPYFINTIFFAGGLSDYLGIPTGVTFPNSATGKVSCMHHSAYQLIWNEYYRDENLQDKVDYKLSDGSNAGNEANLGNIHYRAWMHDYFTSALPFAQKGDPVSLQIAGFQDVDVYYDSTVTNVPTIWDKTGNNLIAQPHLFSNVGGGLGNSGALRLDEGGGVSHDAGFDPNGTLKADTSSLAPTAVTINELRRAEALQTFLEAQARGGSRYVEQNLVQFGVRSADARLQRPEFIGAISNPIVFSEVLQTSTTDPNDPDLTPQGNMAGHGISAGKSARMSYFCQEHGVIMGILSVMPKTGYYQGLEKQFFKFDKFDYAWPLLANLGEQEILNKEVYYASNNADGLNESVFGYTPRYAEYKYINDRVAGAMRSSLDFWHMARKFTSRPLLNSAFITSNPTTRIFAVEDQSVDNVYCHVMFDIDCRRVLPRYGIPTI